MTEIKQIPIVRLSLHPDNPRKNLGDLTELADSIRANGVMQNLTVVPYSDTRKASMNTLDGPTYRVIIGHRRMAAAKLAGLESLPCVVADMSPEKQLAVMLTENIQRNDLTPLEEALGYQQLQIDFGKSAAEISAMSGVSETTVRNRLKIAKMDAGKVQAGLERGATLSDYADLDKIEDPETRDAVLETIGTKNFRNALQRAVTAEKNQKLIAAWEAQAAQFAEKIKEPDWATMESAQDVETWRASEAEITKPEDAGAVKYYYVVSNYGVTIYREKQNPTETEEAEKKRRQEAHDKAKAEAEEIRTRHFNLRCAFIKGLTVKKEFLPALHTFCAKTMLGTNEYSGGGKVGAGVLQKVTVPGIGKALRQKKDWKERKADAFAEAEKKAVAPEKLLLCFSYATTDSENLGYWNNMWNGDLKQYELQHYATERLNNLYDFLCAVGYEMSDEEQQMRDGTHPIFAKEGQRNED